MPILDLDASHQDHVEDGLLCALEVLFFFFFPKLHQET